MTLDDLTDDVETTYAELDGFDAELDEETRRELTMLAAALDSDPDELVRRAIHLLFQTTVDTGRLDFHLRSTYDVTYDEYLSGMTFEEMSGGVAGPNTERDDHRYQF